MRFKKLDLNLLVALDVLLDVKSITRAAERLNMSPSAVSSCLAKLRMYFDDEILSHVGRKLEITALGESLRDPVTDILSRIDSTILQPPVFEPDKTDRKFIISASDYTQLIIGPNLMSLAADQSSTAKFQFIPQGESPHKQLEQGKTDLLIIPEHFVSQDNPYEVLFEEQFVCLVWDKSPWNKKTLTRDNYTSAGHVLMSLLHDRQSHLDIFLKNEYGIIRREAVSSFSLTTLGALLIGTNNIATVHTKLAKLLANVWPLSIVPLPFEIAPMNQCMQWHHYRSKDPAQVWLRNTLISAAKKLE